MATFSLKSRSLFVRNIIFERKFAVTKSPLQQAAERYLLFPQKTEKHNVKYFKMELDLDKVKFVNTNGEISVNVKIEIPKKLYKYYSIDKNSNSSMKNSSLFFSQAHLLNDVMDGNFSLWNLNEYIEKYKRETKNTKKHKYTL